MLNSQNIDMTVAGLRVVFRINRVDPITPGEYAIFRKSRRCSWKLYTAVSPSWQIDANISCIMMSLQDTHRIIINGGWQFPYSHSAWNPSVKLVKCDVTYRNSYVIGAYNIPCRISGHTSQQCRMEIDVGNFAMGSVQEASFTIPCANENTPAHPPDQR